MPMHSLPVIHGASPATRVGNFEAVQGHMSNRRTACRVSVSVPIPVRRSDLITGLVQRLRVMHPRNPSTRGNHPIFAYKYGLMGLETFASTSDEDSCPSSFASLSQVLSGVHCPACCTSGNGSSQCSHSPDTYCRLSHCAGSQSKCHLPACRVNSKRLLFSRIGRTMESGR